MTRTDGTRWPAVAAMVAAGVVAALQVGKVAIGMAAIGADLGLGLEAGGWVMGVFALLGVVGGIPAGTLVARIGDRAVVVAGLAALAAGSVGGALSHGLAPLLAARVVEGAGLLLVVVAAPSVLDRVAAARDRSLAFGIWGSFMPAGIALALLAGLVLDGWRGFWFANAGLCVAAALLFLLLVPGGAAVREAGAAPRTGPMPAGWRGIAVTATARGPLLLAAVFALYNIMYFALVSFLPVLLGERLAVSPAVAGVLSALVVAANIPGNLAGGILLGRGVARWRLIAAAAAVMGLSGVGIFIPGLPAGPVFALCVLFSAVAGLLPSTVMAAAPQVAPAPALAAISVGLVVQGNNLGQVIGPIAVGGAVEAAGWSAAAVPVAVAGLLGLAVAAMLRRPLGE